MCSPGYFGNNIGLNEETALKVLDSEVPKLVKGSKHAYVAWVFHILLIWSLRGVLLFLYNRLTFVAFSLLMRVAFH